jgi:ABC-type Zn2+ transport system substrate-binding protein/surface adhesin
VAISGGFTNDDDDDYDDYDEHEHEHEHDSHVCLDCSIVYRLTVPSHLPKRSNEMAAQFIRATHQAQRLNFLEPQPRTRSRRTLENWSRCSRL